MFDYDGITVAHLGDLKEVPAQSEIELLGTINVALVPVGGGGGLNAAPTEVLEATRELLRGHS